MSDPLRVLHVVGGAEVGGTERQVLLLLDHLDPMRVQSAVVLIRGGPLQDQFAEAVPTTVMPKRGKVDPRFAVRLVRLLRSQGPDIVHTWGTTANLWGGLAARVAGVPCLVVSDRALEEWKGGLLRAADRLVYRGADTVAANSNAVRQSSIGRGAPPGQTVVIPNGVALPERMGGDRDPHLVVCVGRLDRRKGQDVLIAAVPSIARPCPDVRIVLAGPAVHPGELEYAAELRDRIAALGVGEHVEMPGAVADPEPLYRGAAVVVAPSRSEGSPNAVLEALAHGAPVVASAAGGIPELVTGGESGWLVRPDDPDALAAAVVEALTDPHEAARRGAVGRALVESRYAAPAIAAEWTALYDRLARRTRSPR